MFTDFLSAVNSVRRALSIYETRGQQVDWKTVRGMVSLQVRVTKPFRARDDSQTFTGAQKHAHACGLQLARSPVP